VGGLPDQPPDHTERVAAMAIELCREAAALPVDPPLQFRVGIHCGPLVAGVIGVKKFIYDVWGDTVNVASRMESHGVPGQIQVTGDVYARLQDRFRFHERGPIDIRGKGLMATWFLTGRIGDPFELGRPVGAAAGGTGAGGAGAGAGWPPTRP
jgi:class 3 adenylate cyclase